MVFRLVIPIELDITRGDLMNSVEFMREYAVLVGERRQWDGFVMLVVAYALEKAVVEAFFANREF